MVNGLPEICNGKITRRRVTSIGIEQSIIDFVIISADLASNVESMRVDEDSNHALVNFVKSKHEVKKKISDHNVIISRFDIKCSNDEGEKEEFFNFKNEKCQAIFKMNTSNSDKLANIFDNEEDLDKSTKKFLKCLKRVIFKSFKKVRIKSSSNNKYEKSYKIWKKLKNSDDKKNIVKAKKMEEELAAYFYEKVEKEVDGIKCEEGGQTSSHLWKLTKKFNNIYTEPPTALVDEKGNLIISEEGINNENLKHYKNVLKNKPINEELKDHRRAREKLAMMRIENASKNKTPDWTMKDLNVVLKNLKKNKSRDALGLANEIFRPETAGNDLKEAVLKLMNRMKKEQKFPECLELCNVSSIFKKKGSRNTLDSYRGIFRVLVLRYILERLIYNDEFKNIDKNLTDCNVGARKGRNIRDNLFVLNAVLNAVNHDKNKPVDLGVYDVEKCFDSLWIYECINDVYETGMRNDKLSLLYKMNMNAQVAIKTASGITERTNIKDTVMQGTTWGPVFCTTSMDKLGKEVYEDEEFGYKYKGEVKIPPLEMIDDILSVSNCNEKSVEMNAEINAFVEAKKLKLSEDKCSRIQVGNKCEECPVLLVNGNPMKNTHEFQYLGDLTNSSGRPKNTIEERKVKGFAIVSQIMALIKEFPLGRMKVRIGLMLRQAWLLNGTLFNSETWHNITQRDIQQLEAADHHLLRSLFQCHSKIPLEFLFLESSSLPIKYILSA